MVFQKRGGLTLISRIVLFFLVIGFVWLIMYTINYEEPKIPITILNTSSNQISNNSILLFPHDYVWLNISEKTNFSAMINRCEDEVIDINATSSYLDQEITFNPFVKVAYVQNEVLLLRDIGYYEKINILLRHSFYTFTIIGEEENTYSFVDEKIFELQGDYYFRFNSRCMDSSVYLSWEDVI